MTKIKQRTLYREVAERIREMIEHGKLQPAERISEKQLCESFGVSRTPLREALKVLASEGLVELLPNRGARVKQLTLKQVKDTYDLMSALEGLSGELACQHISDEEITRICELHEHMLKHYRNRDLASYFLLNQAIHESILAASNNDVLLEVYNNLSQRIKRIRYSKTMTESYWQQAVKDHEEMIAALKQREGQRLGNILREHLCNKLEVVSFTNLVNDQEAHSAASL